MNSTILI